MRVLFDTNVILDVVLERVPFYHSSALALSRASSPRLLGLVSAHAIPTIAYIVGKTKTARDVRRVLESLLSRLGVAAVTEPGIRRALISPLADFEDAVTLCGSRRMPGQLHRHTQYPRLLPQFGTCNPAGDLSGDLNIAASVKFHGDSVTQTRFKIRARLYSFEPPVPGTQRGIRAIIWSLRISKKSPPIRWRQFVRPSACRVRRAFRRTVSPLRPMPMVRSKAERTLPICLEHRFPFDSLPDVKKLGSRETE